MQNSLWRDFSLVTYFFALDFINLSRKFWSLKLFGYTKCCAKLKNAIIVYHVEGNATRIYILYYNKQNANYYNMCSNMYYTVAK